jgi:tetraacyldisaccharide 4'-kinase
MAGAIAFADHHVYRPRDTEALLALAAAREARLVTTRKDFVKLPPALRAVVLTVTVRLVWQDEPALERLLSGL